ncbi:MAG: hypothetical protein ABIR78_13495 [Ferruginibacter sp.]
MSAITATTIKMPKPIPALKIPAIALQELRVLEMSNKRNTESILKFFILRSFLYNQFRLILCTALPVMFMNKEKTVSKDEYFKNENITLLQKRIT